MTRGRVGVAAGHLQALALRTSMRPSGLFELQGGRTTRPGPAPGDLFPERDGVDPGQEAGGHALVRRSRAEADDAVPAALRRLEEVLEEEPLDDRRLFEELGARRRRPLRGPMARTKLVGDVGRAGHVEDADQPAGAGWRMGAPAQAGC